MDMEREESIVASGRAEIDTSAPFRSVKEAVMLFGERVLVREVYTNKINEMRAVAAMKNTDGATGMRSIVAELEETRQNLERVHEESLVMENCLYTIREELEKTKKELQELKSRETEKRVIDSEIEDLKFVENITEVDIKTPRINEEVEFQRKTYVKFASPPSLAQVINKEDQILERQFSVDKVTAPMKNKKKKPLIRFISAILPKKKGYQERALHTTCSS